MSDNNLQTVLSRQFNHSWALLHQSMLKISDVRWGEVLSNEKDGYWVFSLTIYHILETTDFYMRFSPDGMAWGQKGLIDWKSDASLEEKIIHLTRSLLEQYLAEIKSKMNDIFRLTPVNLLYEADGFYWFPCVLDKYLYLLRHNMMHLGELNKSLRDWKYPRINWE